MGQIDRETLQKLLDGIEGSQIRFKGNLRPYEDYIELLEQSLLNGLKQPYRRIVWFRDVLYEEMEEAYMLRNWDYAEKVDRLLYRSYKIYAREDFEDFCIALEWGRDSKDRFYEPRREQLQPFVEALQDLADGELDELFLSSPPRIGKTTIVMMYVLWNMARNPELANLYVSYSDTITKSFYTGITEIINDTSTYRFRDIFPEIKLPTTKNQMTNAADETIDFDRRKRYHTLTCRSLYGTLNGACDCTGVLVSDDLISGIEESMNRDRMISAWAKVDNNMLSRAKMGSKLLWVGTRWSIIDPAGLRQDLLINDERYANIRYRIISIPALNEKDESNFDYMYGVGFDTDYYRQKRASFERNSDMASWMAQYMQVPIEREGTVFSPEDMRFFNGTLPDEDPDRIFLVIDPAWGGGDYVAGPVCFQYGRDIYVPDVVYSNEDKLHTQPLIAQAVARYNVSFLQIEATKMTADYKLGVEERLGESRCTVTTKTAPNTTTKNQRIFDKAPDIRENFIFLDEGKRPKHYQLFMQNVFSFKISGKNKHDDAPDSLAQAADVAKRPQRQQIQVLQRFF